MVVSSISKLRRQASFLTLGYPLTPVQSTLENGPASLMKTQKASPVSGICFPVPEALLCDSGDFSLSKDRAVLGFRAGC